MEVAGASDGEPQGNFPQNRSFGQLRDQTASCMNLPFSITWQRLSFLQLPTHSAAYLRHSALAMQSTHTAKPAS